MGRVLKSVLFAIAGILLFAGTASAKPYQIPFKSLSSFPDIYSAVTQTGATPETLVVDTLYTVETGNSLTFSPNTYLMFAHGGGVSVATGASIYVYSAITASPNQVLFTGSGDSVFGQSAVSGYFFARWKGLDGGYVGLNEDTPEDALHVSGEDSDIILWNANELGMAYCSSLKLRRSRGGPESAVTPDNTWFLGALKWEGWTENGWGVAGYISGRVDGTPDQGNVPGKIEFRTRNAAGSMDNRVVISSEGALQCESGVTDKGYGLYFIPASRMFPRFSSGASSSCVTEYATNDVNRQVFAFDDGAVEYVGAFEPLPADWDLGTIKAKFVWAPDSSSAAVGQSVRWAMAAKSNSDGGDIDVAYGTLKGIDDLVLTGVTNTTHFTSSTSSITVGGTPAQGAPIDFWFRRKSDDAVNDTMVGDGLLYGVLIQYRHGSGCDAW